MPPLLLAAHDAAHPPEPWMDWEPGRSVITGKKAPVTGTCTGKTYRRRDAVSRRDVSCLMEVGTKVGTGKQQRNEHTHRPTQCVVCVFCCSRRSSKIDGQAASTCLRRPGMANARIKLQPGFAGRQCVSAPDRYLQGPQAWRQESCTRSVKARWLVSVNRSTVPAEPPTAMTGSPPPGSLLMAKPRAEGLEHVARVSSSPVSCQW